MSAQRPLLLSGVFLIIIAIAATFAGCCAPAHLLHDNSDKGHSQHERQNTTDSPPADDEWLKKW